MAITLTNAALVKIKSEMSARGLDPQIVFLRIGIRGGGCSGFSYQLEFDTERGPKDKAFDFSFPEAAENDPHLTVLINRQSYVYLNGATLNYSTEGLGGFAFQNPNATSSCGCGQSFSNH